MYNRYINSLGEQFFTAEPEESFETEPVFPDMGNGPQMGNQGGLRGLFSRFGLTFDIDTVFLLVIVYFLVVDGEDDMMETLLIVAALLFMGF